MDKEEKKEIMMNCFFSAMIIILGIAFSFSVYNIMGLIGHTFMNDFLSFMFIPMFMIIARCVWD